LPSSGLATAKSRNIHSFKAMGSCQSRAANPIDAALLQALIEAKKQRNLKGLTFNELLLKFPKVRCLFKSGYMCWQASRQIRRAATSVDYCKLAAVAPAIARKQWMELQTSLRRPSNQTTLVIVYN
jgi:hypothetical protein